MKQFLQKKLNTKEAREIAGEGYVWCKGNANTYYDYTLTRTRWLTNNCTDLNYLCQQIQPAGYDYASSRYISQHQVVCNYAPTPPYDDFDCIGSLIWC